MPNQLHHVVLRSHSAATFIAFLTDVVGMALTAEMHVPGEVFEATLGWPPSEGADVTILGSGDGGLIEGLAALSFLTDDFSGSKDKAGTFASDVTVFDTGMPGVDLFFCTMGGVPIEFMGSY